MKANNIVKTREEQIEEIRWMFRVRLVAALGFFFTGLILWALKTFTFPIILFSIAPLGEAFLNQPYPFIVRRIKNLHALILFQLVVDIFFITWGIHFLGGMDAIYAVIVYALTILFAGYLLSFQAAVGLAIVSILSYSGLIFLEYFNILPPIPVLELKLDLSIRLGILFVIACALYLLAYFSGVLGGAIRKRGEQATRAREYTEKIIKTIVDTLIVVDPDLKIKTINEAASCLLGYKKEELIGKPIGVIFATVKQEDKAARMQELIEKGSIRDYAMTCKTKSGEEIPVSFSGSVMKEADGKLLGIVGIARDMRPIMRLIQKEKELAATEEAIVESERERSRELQEAYKELKATQKMLIQAEKMAAVGELSTSVAHEVKNPLSIIIQGVNYLEKDIDSSKQNQLEVLDLIRRAVRRSDKIVRDLLNFSRVAPLELKPCNIDSVIDASFDLVQRQLTFENIKIIKDFLADPPSVMIDENQMKQVFINIILNSLQAMRKGGELTIRTYIKKFAELKLGFIEQKAREFFKPQDSVLICEVIDTGRGIAQDKLRNVFEPFFTTKPLGQGIGIGLTITRAIVNAHRGLIDIESKEGYGTMVIVALPIAKGGENEEEDIAHR